MTLSPIETRILQTCRQRTRRSQLFAQLRNDTTLEFISRSIHYLLKQDLLERSYGVQAERRSYPEVTYFETTLLGLQALLDERTVD